MFYQFFFLFIFLSLGLFVTVFKTGKLKTWAKIYRISIVTVAVALFTYYFVTKSLTHFRENSLTIQVINKLPLPLDFYVVTVNADTKAEPKYKTYHLGNIRSDFYRIDYLDMKNSDEFWIAAFMGKKNMVYFSQHALPNKNEDQIIEINNYINQSAKLSEIGKTLISDLKLANMKTAIWITLDLLLLFLNFSLILKNQKK